MAPQHRCQPVASCPHGLTEAAGGPGHTALPQTRVLSSSCCEMGPLPLLAALGGSGLPLPAPLGPSLAAGRPLGSRCLGVCGASGCTLLWVCLPVPLLVCLMPWAPGPLLSVQSLLDTLFHCLCVQSPLRTAGSPAPFPALPSRLCVTGDLCPGQGPACSLSVSACNPHGLSGDDVLW